MGSRRGEREEKTKGTLLRDYSDISYREDSGVGFYKVVKNRKKFLK